MCDSDWLIEYIKRAQLVNGNCSGSQALTFLLLWPRAFARNVEKFLTVLSTQIVWGCLPLKLSSPTTHK